MISFFNRLIFFLLVLTLTNCSTNKTFTTLDKDFRKVDVFNQNKEVVRTYYQKFNSKVSDWLNVTCVYAYNKINKKILENQEKCRFTNISNSIINNRNKESNENFSINNSSKYDNGSSKIDESQNNQNNNSNQDENNINEGQPNNPGELPEANNGQNFENCNDPQKC